MGNAQTEDEFIGTAWMEADGTINMRLKAVGPGVYGVGTITYPQDHPNYAQMLKHIGAMIPGGDKVNVRPFPE